jgi:anti-sigma regulatory factor (Ser/Thr protein kinase)
MSSYRVRELLDVHVPRQAVQSLAQRLGFQSNTRQELAIVVSELASNIVKYGVFGSIELEPVTDSVKGVGIQIVARDAGPPFHDFWMAMQDGCDDHGPIDPAHLLKRGGLGIGLGAVVRLTDSLHVEQRSNGKEIRVVKYLEVPRGERR